MGISKWEYLKLIREIQKHNEHYFQENAPLISDYEYDLLVKRAETAEKAHPEWVAQETPTQHIGETPTVQDFQTVKHSIPMLSLSNTYSEQEIIDFVNRMEKLLGKRSIEYCVELKIDGVAIALRYQKGVLAQGITRGDGQYGDDITHNLSMIASLPLKPKGDLPYSAAFEVRGEVFIPRKAFMEMNRLRRERGEREWANPRNATAGSLKLLDPKKKEGRKLDLICYHLHLPHSPLRTQEEILDRLTQMGFPTGISQHHLLCHNSEEILTFAEKVAQFKPSLPFEIDGIVIKVNHLADQKKVGFTHKSPRWATAYKFAPKQVETVVKKICVQVGRTGVLTPVAELEPVVLSGSTISRVTLHNFEEITRKDIRVGDYVIVAKGGEVIPKVVKSVVEKRTSDLCPYSIPASCPMCGSPLVKKGKEVALRCSNFYRCRGQTLRTLSFFTGKKAMDIPHLGRKVVERLFSYGLIVRPSDLYRLTDNDLRQVEGFQDKSIDHLLKGIASSKKPSLSRLIYALGIPLVGEESAHILAKRIGSLKKLMICPPEELEKVEGIGPKMSHSIFSFFQDPNSLEEIHTLLAMGITPKEEEKVVAHSYPFADKNIVLTGKLIQYTRSQAAEIIRKGGGRVMTQVNLHTHYVIVGEEPGTKYQRACELGIPCLQEEEWIKMFSSPPPHIEE